jgi:predicted dehydrogenase
MEESLIRKHLPFFVEKPLATDIATPLRIDKELARSGVATAVGYHWRHLESTHRLRRELSGKRVHLAIAQWHDGLPGSPWWWDRIQSGGQVIEQATHLIDLCQMVLGDISRVSAFETQFPSLAGSLVQSNVPSATVASVTFSSGAVAAITCTYAMQARHCIQVEFISDGLSLTVTENGLRTVRGVEQHYYECQSDAFLRQAVEFVGMVKGKKPINLPSYHEALRSHGAAVAIANAANNSGGDK